MNGSAYVRQSSHENDSRPWQVRWNRPDQTFEVLARFPTEEEAEGALLECPEGVELLLDDDALDARITVIRRTCGGKVTDELRRLVAEESKRGLARAGLAV